MFRITPEKNFFIQGFMGMAWFMIPASLVICTVLLNQTERADRWDPENAVPAGQHDRDCALRSLRVLLLLAAVQMLLSLGRVLYLRGSRQRSRRAIPSSWSRLYVCEIVCGLYAAAIPMAAVYWAISTAIPSPIFSVGIGLASIVPSVLLINTKIWFAYPMSYPFYLLMVAYGRAAEGVYETQIAWLPWLPAAVGITILALVISCVRFGASERRSKQ